MFFRLLVFVVFAFPLALVGCKRVKVTTAPQGAIHIDCAKGMRDCVNRAQRTCGDKGYVVLGGSSRNKLLGGSSSPYRKLSEYAQLEVRCGVDEQPEEPDVVFKLPKRKDVPPESAAEQAPVPPAAERACIPGSTQRCIGPGACEGGQVCLGDGSGFGACDCGSAKGPRQEAPSAASKDEKAKPSPAEVTTAPVPPGEEESKVPEVETPKPVPLKE